MDFRCWPCARRPATDPRVVSGLAGAAKLCHRAGGPSAGEADTYECEGAKVVVELRQRRAAYLEQYRGKL